MPNLLPSVIDAVLEVIGAGDNVVSAVLLEQLGDPGAATAAAEHAEIDLGVGTGAAHELRLYNSKR